MTRVLASGLALVFLTCGFHGVTAGEVLLGSPEFCPSPEHPFGWRGDGSGQFPGATPPVHWERMAMGVKELRSQAAKPKEGETGSPITDGVIREWLVLGPVPLAEEENFIKGLTNKVDLAPAANDKVVNLSWSKVAADGATLDFYDLYGEKGASTTAVAFAHAYLYSGAKTKFRLIKEIDNINGGNSIRTYVNGVLQKGRDFELEKGWNSIMLRVVSGMRLPSERIRKQVRNNDPASMVIWYVQPIIYGVPGGEYAGENIRWTVRLPGWSIASPVIAGDRIFVLGDWRTLSCVDKMTGKILWTRTTTFYDAATEEEKKASPEIFKELEPMLARLAELDKMFTTSAVTGQEKILVEKGALEGKIEGLMVKVDKAKYEGKAGPIGEPGYASRTPVTDGENIYVNYHPCLTVCYDMDGNRKWVHHYRINVRQEHGYHGSPCLVDGKLVLNTDRYIALDAQTGKAAWEVEGNGSSSLVGAKFGGEAIVFNGRQGAGGVGALRVKDGNVIVKPASNFATPIIQGNMIYAVPSMNGERGTGLESLEIARISPEKQERLKTIRIETLKFIRFPWVINNLASPLYHDGLVYIVNVDGLLSVVDVEKHELVYQKVLDIDSGPGGVSRGAQASSPALGGKYIYVFGNEGTCVVFEPGRQYKQVAKNRVESYCTGYVYWGIRSGTLLEQTLSCPVFEGSRMYYTGLVNLYCIEEKKEKKEEKAAK